MKIIRIHLWLILSQILLCYVSAAQPKQEVKLADSEKTTRISLTSASGEPGQPVLVTIYLTPAEGVEVGGVKLEITYVSANLKFDKLEPGITAEIADIDLTSNTKTGKNEEGVETSTLTIQTKPTTSQNGSKGIPGGLFAFLTLRISASGRPAVITLRTMAEAFELGSNKLLANLRTSDATVEVFAAGTQPPAVACFFFTH